MSVFLLLFFVIGSIYLGGYLYRSLAGKCRCKTRMEGKVVLITGANSGIGKYTAFDLARRGAKVIMGCRSQTKAQVVSDWITQETGNKNIVIYELDLSDLDSVRSFSKQVLGNEKQIDILINNAGGGARVYTTSVQGYELTYATNHLGHFLLTHLLIGLLQKSSSARIINVSSLAHYFGGFDLSDIHFKRRPYSFWKAYVQSKLANILFTNEFAKLFNGKGIASYSLHPGTVGTEIVNKEGTLLGKIVTYMGSVIGKTPLQGAQTSIHLAVSNDIEIHSGKYFVDCKVASKSKAAKNCDLANALWKISEKESQLREEEKMDKFIK